MSPQLTVHNAQVSTASVQIKTLTISGKQVTLAVFRQLREEPLIAEDGTLNGTPWGTVNYHPGKCGNAEPHWHVVWQRGDELLRSAIACTPRWETFWCEEADRFYAACVHHWLLTGDSAYQTGGLFDLFTGELRGYSGLIKADDRYGQRNFVNRLETYRSNDQQYNLRIEVDIDQETRNAILAEIDVREARGEHDQAQKVPAVHIGDYAYCVCPACKIPKIAEKIAEAEADRDAKLAQLARIFAGVPLPELHEEYLTAVRGEAERRQHHQAVRDVFKELPQLFIAV
jgi:hypothetical protein